jgi:putative hydrolase of the HAD superfamily
MRALLVDLDDTLLDYTGGVDDSWLAACAAVAAPAGVAVGPLVRAIAGARRWFWSDPERHRRERTDMPGAWRKIAERGLGEIGAPPALGAGIAEDFAARRWARMALFPGVTEALDHLRRRGVSLALVTNGDRAQQRRKVEQYDLGRFFDVILIEGELGVGKPDAAVYRHALDALGAAPSGAWMVGDNLEWDVIAPQRLGLRGVWVDARGQGVAPDHPTPPHLILRAFTEILAVLRWGDDGAVTAGAAELSEGPAE